MTNPESPFMNTKELAVFLKCSRTFILHNRETHPLFSKAVRVSERPNAPLLWKKADVHAFVESLGGAQ